MFHQPNHSHRPHDYEPRVREGTTPAYVIGIVVAAATVFGASILLTSPDEKAEPPVVQVPQSPDSGERIEPPLVEVSDSHAVYSLREGGFRFEMSQEVALRTVCAGGADGKCAWSKMTVSWLSSDPLKRMTCLWYSQEAEYQMGESPFLLVEARSSALKV